MSEKLFGPAIFITSFILFTRYKNVSSLLSMLRMSSSTSRPSGKLLKAKKVPHDVKFGYCGEDEDRGDNPMNPPRIRKDDYHWLRDETRKNPEVLEYLNAENDYCQSNMEHLKPLQKSLYDDMLSHLKETDEDVPYKHGNYEYYSRTVQGLAYKIHCRKPSPDSTEEVILDENELAKGFDYTVVSDLETSPSHQQLAYSVDHNGYETYTVYVKDLKSGSLLTDVIENTDGTITYGYDDTILFYMTMDDEHRPDKVYMHKIGTKQVDDICIFEEEDSMFWLGIGKTATERFFVIDSGSKETSESHILDLFHLQKIMEDHLNNNKSVAELQSAVKTALRCVSPREFGVRYDVEHLMDKASSSAEKDSLLIVTNKDKAKSNKLVSVAISEVGDSKVWKDVKPYDDRIQVDSVQPFTDHVAIFGRSQGFEQIWITSQNDLTQWKQLTFDEAVYSVWAGPNYVYNTSTLRLVYSSLVSPKTTYEYDMKTDTKVVLKIQEVPKYDKSQYMSLRMEATAKDGKKIPMSLVFHKSLESQVKAGKKANQVHGSSTIPTILYGYGSYGASIDPVFDYKLITLLDRGIVYCIGHIRGGGEMGRSWYEDEGKYFTKLNTFSDFAACAEQLVNVGITSHEQLAIVGRSAGGLLVGACCNMYPKHFKVAIADVPFVDALNTMCDPSIPLTVTEWEEWGNPNEESYFDYMLKYSPYDNVVAQDYPSMLVTAGLNDPRVMFWEPAKWVAKLRELKTDKNPLYLKTDMSSGHFSASNRYKYLEETAFEYSFIIDQICSAGDKK